MSYPSSIDTFEPLVNDPGGDEADANQINVIYTAVTAIETELGTDVAGSADDLKTRLSKSINAAGYLQLDSPTGLTINSGAVTVSRNYHTLDTEGSASSDDLDTINGGDGGDLVFLRTVNASRDVIIKHGTDNILCTGGADITLGEVHNLALGIYDANLSKWIIAKLF